MNAATGFAYGVIWASSMEQALELVDLYQDKADLVAALQSGIEDWYVDCDYGAYIPIHLLEIDWDPIVRDLLNIASLRAEGE